MHNLGKTLKIIVIWVFVRSSAPSYTQYPFKQIKNIIFSNEWFTQSLLTVRFVKSIMKSRSHYLEL